jgi:hypothetical protein
MVIAPFGCGFIEPDPQATFLSHLYAASPDRKPEKRFPLRETLRFSG